MSYQILIETLYLKTKMWKKCGIFSNPNFIIVWTIIYQKEGMWMDKNAKLAIINKQRAWRIYKYSRTLTLR